MEQSKHWAVLQDTLALRPIGDRILIMEDEFKSRFDCKTCNGKGHTGEVCPHCMGTKVYKGRTKEDSGPCPDCTIKGVKEGVSRNPIDITYGKVLCPLCNGKQGTIIVPDDAKKRPTTGTIIAIGKEVTEYNVGSRVLYHNYSGTEFEMQNTKLRIMRQMDVFCEVRGLDNVEEVKPVELTDVGMNSERTNEK